MKKILLGLFAMSTLTLAQSELFDFENAEPVTFEVGTKVNAEGTFEKEKKSYDVIHSLDGKVKLYEFGTISAGLGYGSETDNPIKLAKEKTYFGLGLDFQNYGNGEVKYVFQGQSKTGNVTTTKHDLGLLYNNKTSFDDINVNFSAGYTASFTVEDTENTVTKEETPKAEETTPENGSESTTTDSAEGRTASEEQPTTAAATDEETSTEANKQTVTTVTRKTTVKHNVFAKAVADYDLFDNLKLLGTLKFESPLTQEAGLSLTTFIEGGVEYTNIVKLLAKLNFKYKEEEPNKDFGHKDFGFVTGISYTYNPIDRLIIVPDATMSFEHKDGDSTYSSTSTNTKVSSYSLTLTPSVKTTYKMLDGENLVFSGKLGLDVNFFGTNATSSDGNTTNPFGYNKTQLKFETGVRYSW